MSSLHTPMNFSVALATEDDAPALARLRTAVAVRLTEVYGKGHWSSAVAERGVLRGLRYARVLVARSGPTILGTLRLATKKPWAIDVSYFTAAKRALYLTDMAVDPEWQRQGIGRRLMAEAADVARAWPASAIRLDAYDAAAGAGDFYAKCGLTEVGRVTYRQVPLIYFELVL
jgi:GNAT superfamily N-acetyltransferase